MIFVGYEHGSKTFRAYDPVAQHVHVTRDVVFDEDAQWDWLEAWRGMRQWRSAMTSSVSR